MLIAGFTTDAEHVGLFGSAFRLIVAGVGATTVLLQGGLNPAIPWDFYPTLVSHLSSTMKGVPVMAIVYLTGVGASVLHFANGLWGFCFSWGICVSRRSQRLFAVAFAAIGTLERRKNLGGGKFRDVTRKAGLIGYKNAITAIAINASTPVSPHAACN
jgi:urea transporter